MASIHNNTYSKSPLSRSVSSHTQTSSIHPSRLREIQEKKMAYSQTCQLAQRARGKLQKEASRHDHDLRFLVGHANLLDSLMIAIAAAEREQAMWFQEAISGNMMDEEEEEEDMEEESRDWPQQGQEWLATDYYSDSSESEDEDEEEEDSEDEEWANYCTTSSSRITRQRSEQTSSLPTSASLPSYYQTVVGVSEVDEYDNDFEMDEDEEVEPGMDVDADGLYPLQRAPSHGSPPMLVADLSDDDEDEATTPPSPPQLSLPFSAKAKERMVTTSFYDHHHDHHHSSMSSRSHHSQPQTLSHEQDSLFDEGTEFLQSTHMISTF